MKRSQNTVIARSMSLNDQTSKPIEIRIFIAWAFIYIGIFVLLMEAVDKISFGGVGPGLGIFMIGLIWLAAPFRQTYFPDRRTPTLT